MTNQIIFELFSSTIQAAEILKKDLAFADTLRKLRQRLPPMQIGQHGQLQEWLDDIDDPKDNHRHISHLYGLFPSNQTPSSPPPSALPVAHHSPLLAMDERMTNFVVGLEVAAPAGAAWALAPQLGGLAFAEGGFSTALGRYRAAWALLAGGGGYSVTVSTPPGTTGLVLLPLLGDDSTEASVEFDGATSTWSAAVVGRRTGYSQSVGGGNHTFVVRRVEKS